MVVIKSSNIAVTGASGFIGAHLVATLLKDGYTNVVAMMSSDKSQTKLIKILDLYDISPTTSSLTIKYGDLCYYKDVEDIFKNIDIIFHTAAKVDLSGSDNLIYDNVLMTECVVAAATKFNVKRLVHVSSIATLEPPVYPKLCTENMPINSISNKSNYAISKLYCENVIWRAAAEGLNVSVVLPSVVLGTGSTPSGSASLLDIYSNTLGFYSDGVMGYVYVEDVAKAMILLAFDNKAVGEKYILSSENISYKELFTRCAAAKSNKTPKHRAGRRTLSFISHTISILNKIGLQLPISSRTPYVLGEKSLYDGSKISKELGFVYTPISEAVSSTLKRA